MTNKDVGFPTVKAKSDYQTMSVRRIPLTLSARGIPRPTGRFSFWATPSGSKRPKFPSKLRKTTIFTRNFLLSHTFRQLSANRLSPFIRFPTFYDTLHDRHICQTAFTRTRIAPNFQPSTASSSFLSQKSHYFPS